MRSLFSVFRSRARGGASTFAALAVSLGCGGSDKGPTASEADSSISMLATPDGGPACVSGQREPCVCSTGGIGTRACQAGVFAGACEGCEMRSDTSTGTLCVPGRYEGTYDVPNYYPTPAGACGLISLFGGGGKGTWKFSLSGGGGEFITVVEAESCLELDTSSASDAGVASADAGVGDGGAAIEPLKLSLAGKVDCATGEFTGEIRGTYRSVSVCTLGMTEDQYFVKGPISATFDPATNSFVEGSVALHEPPPLLPFGAPPGGSGTWSASLNPNGLTPPPEDCLGGVPFEDFTVP